MSIKELNFSQSNSSLVELQWQSVPLYRCSLSVLRALRFMCSVREVSIKVIPIIIKCGRLKRRRRKYRRNINSNTGVRVKHSTWLETGGALHETILTPTLGSTWCSSGQRPFAYGGGCIEQERLHTHTESAETGSNNGHLAGLAAVPIR